MSSSADAGRHFPDEGAPGADPLQRDYRRLRVLFDHAARSRGFQVEQHSPALLMLRDDEGRQGFVPIALLFKRVASLDPAMWPGQINDFFQSLGPVLPVVIHRSSPDDVAWRTKKLRLTLKSDAFVQRKDAWKQGLVEGGFTHEMFAESLDPFATADVRERRMDQLRVKRDAGANPLYVVLVIDRPQSTIILSNAQVGDNANHFLKIAKQNLIAQTPSSWFEVLDEEIELCWMNLLDGYDASRALALDELLPGKAEHGWFVAPIGRENVYFAPMREAHIDRLIPMMQSIVDDEFPTTPNALSNRIYWVYEGVWRLFFVNRGNEQFPIITPPLRFQELFRMADLIPESERLPAAPDPPQRAAPAERARSKVIRFRCQSCQYALRVSASQSGKKAKCPQCGAGVVIPGA